MIVLGVFAETEAKAVPKAKSFTEAETTTTVETEATPVKFWLHKLFDEPVVSFTIGEKAGKHCPVTFIQCIGLGLNCGL